MAPLPVGKNAKQIVMGGNNGVSQRSSSKLSNMGLTLKSTKNLKLEHMAAGVDDDDLIDPNDKDFKKEMKMLSAFSVKNLANFENLKKSRAADGDGVFLCSAGEEGSFVTPATFSFVNFHVLKYFFLFLFKINAHVSSPKQNLTHLLRVASSRSSSSSSFSSDRFPQSRRRRPRLRVWRPRPPRLR